MSVQDTRKQGANYRREVWADSGWGARGGSKSMIDRRSSSGRTSKGLCRTTAPDAGNAGRQRSGEEEEEEEMQNALENILPSMGLILLN